MLVYSKRYIRKIFKEKKTKPKNNMNIKRKNIKMMAYICDLIKLKNKSKQKRW